MSRDGTPARPWSRTLALIGVVALTAETGRAQTPRPDPAGPFRPVRFDENYSYLRDSVRHGWWQPLKYVPLGQGSSLSSGGELRVQYERLDHPSFGASPPDLGGYGMQRAMLHADWRIGSAMRLFGQLASALEQGRTGGPRPTDVDTLRLHQAFLEGAQTTGAGRFWGRVGRQELIFGGSRTFSPRDPANVRRSFDAVRGGWVGRRVALDGFWGRQVRVGPGVFRDPSDSTRFTWGAFGTVTLEPTRLWLDAYLFRDHRDAARFAQGTAPTNRAAGIALERRSGPERSRAPIARPALSPWFRDERRPGRPREPHQRPSDARSPADPAAVGVCRCRRLLADPEYRRDLRSSRTAGASGPRDLEPLHRAPAVGRAGLVHRAVRSRRGGVRPLLPRRRDYHEQPRARDELPARVDDAHLLTAPPGSVRLEGGGGWCSTDLRSYRGSTRTCEPLTRNRPAGVLGSRKLSGWRAGNPDEHPETGPNRTRPTVLGEKERDA